MKYSVLAIDDEENNLQLITRTLRKKFDVHTVSSSLEALELVKNTHFDMVISDYKMPEIDGIELLKRIMDIKPDAIRILVTAYTDATILTKAINSGKIYRYIKKPWSPEDLTKIIESAFEVNRLNIDNQRLALDFKELFSGTITTITEALDAKDSFTYGRSKRVTFYALQIARAMNLPDQELIKIELAGMLHDIGMIGVPQKLINKSEKLTTEEYEIIKNHVSLGIKILEEIKQLESVIDIIKYHHERFDGTGYPYGLKGEDISIGAKIIAVADTYDSMTSDRPYRKGLAQEQALEKIKELSGTQLDPTIAEVFINCFV